MNHTFIRGLLEAARHVLWKAEIECEPELRDSILDICVAIDKCIDKINPKETNED